MRKIKLLGISVMLTSLILVIGCNKSNEKKVGNDVNLEQASGDSKNIEADIEKLAVDYYTKVTGEKAPTTCEKNELEGNDVELKLIENINGKKAIYATYIVDKNTGKGISSVTSNKIDISNDSEISNEEEMKDGELTKLSIKILKKHIEKNINSIGNEPMGCTIEDSEDGTAILNIGNMVNGEFKQAVSYSIDKNTEEETKL